MMEHWSNAFVGIPHLDHGRTLVGCDCWGLVRLVFARQLGIDLPSYAEGYISTDEHAEISALIGGAKESTSWARVDGLAMPFDIAVFRRGRLDAHVGVVVSDGLMLHMAEGAHSCLEHYRGGKWATRRSGVYRHHRLVARVTA